MIFSLLAALIAIHSSGMVSPHEPLFNLLLSVYKFSIVQILYRQWKLLRIYDCHKYVKHIFIALLVVLVFWLPLP